MEKFDIISSRAPRIDTPDKATGKAVFIDDISKPGMLYGALLQSPHAHAKILSIDTSKAEKLEGVKAVITSKDAGSVKYGVSPARYDETVFAIDKVLYVGDEIAAVAAVSLETAQQAVQLIKVEYEILPAVFTVEDALKKEAPQLHENFPNNLCAQVHQEFGNVEEG
ncbi:MAG: 4-hydroxybenzoyl-CoA reductase, partial [Desulfobacula sp.]|nr:4-hydroxybenzoyl-CoA reductase [Desulfobacula sp.]